MAIQLSRTHSLLAHLFFFMKLGWDREKRLFQQALV